MEFIDSDATASSGKTARSVCFRPSRSRERRRNRTSYAFFQPRHNPLFIPKKKHEEVLEMTDTRTRTQETLFPEVERSRVMKRHKISPIPLTFRIDEPDLSNEPFDEAKGQRTRKVPHSVLIREPSSHTRRSNSPRTSSGTRTTPDPEKFSSTLSVRDREKSELSQIVSQIFRPRKAGIKQYLRSLTHWLYNREEKSFCGRTCKSWLCIIMYAIMYLIFQMTFTLFLLYVSLLIINTQDRWPDIGKAELQTYAQKGIGLSAVPASEGSLPVIWFKSKDPNDFKVYVDAIDYLFRGRKTNATELESLGPCGQTPYGYGEAPCIIVRINKQLGWSAGALTSNSSLTSTAPPDVQKWIQAKRMLWLHCDGYNHYDREHIRNIKYYPHPPGINPDIFPLDMEKDSPLIAVQFSDFTKGLSIGIQCKLWYDTGTSAVEFVIYVLPEGSMNTGRALCKVC